MQAGGVIFTSTFPGIETIPWKGWRNHVNFAKGAKGK